MIMAAQHLRTFERDGAVAERDAFGAAGDDADVLHRCQSFNSGFDCSRCGGVRARFAVALFEFLASADGSDIDDAVDRKNAVEMIHLMLQEFREIAAFSGAEFEALAVEVLVTNG